MMTRATTFRSSSSTFRRSMSPLTNCRGPPSFSLFPSRDGAIRSGHPRHVDIFPFFLLTSFCVKTTGRS